MMANMEEGWREIEEGVGVDQKKKRNRDEKSIQIFKGVKRTNPYIEKTSLSEDFFFYPPKIAQLLAFTVKREVKRMNELADQIIYGASVKQLEETEKCTKELREMIASDVRLCDELKPSLLKLLVDMLEHKHNPKLQCHVAMILRSVVAYSSNRKVVIEYIDPSIFGNLIRSEDFEVQEKAMLFLNYIALAIPCCPEIEAKIKSIIDEALESLIFFLTKDPTDTDDELLYVGAVALAAICQEYPKLPSDKLESVLFALKSVFNREEISISHSACLGYAFLCDGREDMVVESKTLGQLIDRLIALINSLDRVEVIAGLTALGTFVRWGSDDDTKLIIEKGAMSSFPCLLRRKDSDITRSVCWIISNLTAGNEDDIQAVIDSELIDPLVGVVEDFKYLDAKLEAAWAISNAIYGSNFDQREYFRKSCTKPLWNLMKASSDNGEIVSLCLEALIKLKVVTITCNGGVFNDAEWLINFKNFVLRSHGQFELAGGFECLTKLKKLRHGDNVEKADKDMLYHLSLTFNEDGHSPDSRYLVEIYK